jgi:hypothetical protein
MTIITQDYQLTTKDSFSLDAQRLAMGMFVFSLESAIDLSPLVRQSRNLNYLPIKTLFPEHNESLHPILLTPQILGGIDEEVVRAEPSLRRIYQFGRSTMSIRCIPNYEKKLDELQFIFSGAYPSDVSPAVKAIEGIVNNMSPGNGQVLEWYANE